VRWEVARRGRRCLWLPLLLSLGHICFGSLWVRVPLGSSIPCCAGRSLDAAGATLCCLGVRVPSLGSIPLGLWVRVPCLGSIPLGLCQLYNDAQCSQLYNDAQCSQLYNDAKCRPRKLASYITTPNVGSRFESPCQLYNDAKCSQLYNDAKCRFESPCLGSIPLGLWGRVLSIPSNSGRSRDAAKLRYKAESKASLSLVGSSPLGFDSL
jgi:hypothetical protein